jgi:hypothetical protein
VKTLNVSEKFVLKLELAFSLLLLLRIKWNFDFENSRIQFLLAGSKILFHENSRDFEEEEENFEKLHNWFKKDKKNVYLVNMFYKFYGRL